MRKLLPLLVIAATGALAGAAIQWLPETLYFPRVDLRSADDLHIIFLRHARSTRADCQHDATTIAAAIHARCPACKVTAQCGRGLSATDRKALSGEALQVPVARSDQGIAVMFEAADAHLALSVCQATAAQTAGEPAAARLFCDPAGPGRAR